MLINLIVVIIPKCIRISKHRVVHLKYIQFLFVDYTSIKLKKKERKKYLVIPRGKNKVFGVTNWEWGMGRRS